MGLVQMHAVEHQTELDIPCELKEMTSREYRYIPGAQAGSHSREGRGRWPVRWLSCSTATRKGGYQQRSSRSHCRSTVAGHTTIDGRNLFEWWRPARNAATCANKHGTLPSVIYRR